MWFKFATYTIFLFPLFITTTTMAKTAKIIVFNGAIVEDSCSPTSSNIECKHLTHAINKVKTTNKVDHLLTKNLRILLIYIFQRQL